MNQFPYAPQGAQSSQSSFLQPPAPEHLERHNIAYLSMDGAGAAPSQMVPAKGKGFGLDDTRRSPNELKLTFSVDVVHDVFKNLNRTDVYKKKRERIKEFTQIGGERAIDDLRTLIHAADKIVIWIRTPCQHYCQRPEPSHFQQYCVTSPNEVEKRPTKWKTDSKIFSDFAFAWEDALKKALARGIHEQDSSRVQVHILCDKTVKISHTNDAFREQLMEEIPLVKSEEESSSESEKETKQSEKESKRMEPEKLLQWLVVFNFVAYNEPK